MQFLKAAFHLQLLQNIGYIPCYRIHPWASLTPIVCTHSSTLTPTLPFSTNPTGNY